jgi:hypothetical protein
LTAGKDAGREFVIGIGSLFTVDLRDAIPEHLLSNKIILAFVITHLKTPQLLEIPAL